MRSFNAKLETKYGVYEVINNELLLDGKEGYHQINAKDANALIQLVYDAAKHFVVTHVSFEETIKDVVALLETKEFLVDLKRRNCHDTLHKFEETNSAFFHEKINKVKEHRLSIPENFVYQTVLGGNEFRLNYILERDELIKKSKEELAKLKKEYLSYPYKKYVSDDKKIIKSITEVFEETEKILTTFETFKKENGDDLINWTQHKVSRRTEDHNIRYAVWRLVEEYQKVLKKKGVKATEKTKTKIAALEKAEGDADFVRCFKSGPTGDTWVAFNQISFKRKLELIQEDTKVVVEKIKSNWSEFVTNFERDIVPSKECVDAMLVLVNRLNPIVSDRYATKYQVTWDFFNKNIEHLSYSKFLEFKPFERELSGEVTDATFEKLVKRFPKEKQLTYSSEVSKHFISRMNNSEKITVLNNYKDVYLADSLMSDLFASVPVETLRKFAVKNYSKTKYILNLLKESLHFKREVLTNLDMLDNILGEDYSNDDKGCNPQFYNSLNKDEKFKAILNWYSDERQHRYNHSKVLKILTKKQLEELFLQEITTESYALTSDILKKYSDKGSEVKALLNKALDLGKPLYLAIDSHVLSGTDVVMRIKLLAHNIALPNENVGSYPEKVKNTTTYAFLKGIPRNVLDKHEMFYGYAMYVADRMTKEELMEYAQNSTTFVRAHLETIPKSFLNNIRNDKNYLKKLVGDCRDRTNKSFAHHFKEVTNFTNSLDFILNLAS